MTTESREERWLAARWAREAAATAHPFKQGETLPDSLIVRDEPSSSSVALVVFTGAQDRMGVPVADFFSVVTRPCFRVLVRKLALPLTPHELGRDVSSARQALNTLLEGRPSLFVGNSVGAFSALLFGTLCRADSVLAVNPTTSLLTDNLRAWGDGRYDHWDALDHVPPEHLDIPLLWQRFAPPRTVVHFGYRDAPHRAHAEHIAEIEGVELFAHYENQAMYKLFRTHALGPIIDGMLRDIEARRIPGAGRSA